MPATCDIDSPRHEAMDFAAQVIYGGCIAVCIRRGMFQDQQPRHGYESHGGLTQSQTRLPDTFQPSWQQYLKMDCPKPICIDWFKPLNELNNGGDIVFQFRNAGTQVVQYAKHISPPHRIYLDSSDVFSFDRPHRATVSQAEAARHSSRKRRSGVASQVAARKRQKAVASTQRLAWTAEDDEDDEEDLPRFVLDGLASQVKQEGESGAQNVESPPTPPATAAVDA